MNTTDNGYFKGHTKAKIEDIEKWMERVEGKIDDVCKQVTNVRIRTAALSAAVACAVNLLFLLLK